jgi:hypothetical protein
MQNLLYIPSLHRPFNQQLKTARWVCDFVMSSKVKLVGSHFNVKFYIYLIKSLNKEYKKKQLEEYNGLPSESAVFAAYEFLNGKSESDLIKEIPLIINNRVSSLDRQIYSTYKAASYFINLAKDKFKLIDNKNRLTPNGKKLLSFRSPFFKLSLKEKEFFFERIIEVDFHFFISNCFFTKLRKKYKIKDLTKEQFDFLDKFYGIKHFNFTSSSLGNFNKVRNHWIEELEVLDTNGNIKRKYLKIISNLQFDLPFQELNQKLDLYEKENLKNKKKYIDRKGKFLKAYRNSFNSNLSDLGFINLYDIKEAMKMSYNNYQNFLQDFYENEKLNINIFFNNTVNSIDRRKRFYIRNIPVINIKIK